MGKLGVAAVPKDVVLGFGKFCANHCLYHLKMSYYLNVSWGQMIFYKAIKWMIHEDTLAK